MILRRAIFSRGLIYWVLTLFVAVLVHTSVLASPDEDERRVALVIGISDYKTIPRLANTLNDADLISETLSDLSFDVLKLENPGLEEFQQSLDAFAFMAETADVAMVYFAGHGLEFGGENYLIPQDSDAASRKDVAQSAVSLARVLKSVELARQMRIVVLDSCRDNPFGGADAGITGTTVRSTSTTQGDTPTPLATRGLAGLAEPSPARGTLVAFAAEAGRAALDGTGQNSPFSLALAQHLSAPDLEIGLAFRRVRDDVLKTTGSLQVPHTYGSLSGDPYFLAGTSAGLNLLEDEDRKGVWARLDVEQVDQLETLASEGDLRALKGLAYMRLDPNGSRFDPTKAASLLEQAAGENDPEALYELGRLFEIGIGVTQDVDRAVTLYQAAADLDFGDAINDLGFLNFQGGLGVPRNVPKALSYFESAAELRHPEAMFNFAALIDDGLVEGRGHKDAGRYLYQALRSGNEDVLNQLLERPNVFKRGVREELQRLMKENELYSGAVDASFGPQTKRSLKRAYGLEE